MLEKKYYLGHGNNAFAKGGGRFLNEGDNKSNYYSSNLMDFFDRNEVNFKYKYLQVKHQAKFIQTITSNEYQEFCKAYLDKNGDLLMDLKSVSERLEKIFDLMGENFRQNAERHIEKMKKESKPYVELIEKIYKDALLKPSELKMKIENGKAVLNGEFLTHNFPYENKIEEYEARQKLGIIASEFFGKSESMQEGAFCSFFTKHNNIEPKKDKFTTFQFENFGEPLTPSFSLIIDASASAVKQLLEDDFFNYMRNKNNKSYTSKLDYNKRNMFNFIEQHSMSAQHIANENPDWVAIPGGVPAQFIVGIMAHSIKKGSPEENMAKEVAKLFNVPLIDTELNVVYNPFNSKNKTKTNIETEIKTNKENCKN